MIDLVHTAYQPVLSKSENFVILEYYQPSSIPAGVPSDTFGILLPNITGFGWTYCPSLSSVKIQTESTNFTLKIAEDEAHFDNNDLILEVVEIDSLYYETNMNIFCKTVNYPDHKLVMQIINNDVTDILNVKLRLVFEIFQYTSAFI